MSPYSVDQFLGVQIVNFATKSCDINLNDVAEFFPIIIVQVLKQLRF